MSTKRTTALARGLEYGCLCNGNKHCKIHRFTITSTAFVPNYLQSIGSAFSPFSGPDSIPGWQSALHPPPAFENVVLPSGFENTIRPG